MKKTIWLVSAIALTVAGCAHDPGPGAPDSSKVGSLSVELVGADSSGQQYRLRNAEFQIYNQADYYGGTGGGYYGGYDGGGPIASDGNVAYDSTITVSSETDPDAAVITTSVTPGTYYVTLVTDGYLEKITANGPQPVAQSVLLSDRTQYAYVWDGGESDVVYRFGVDGTLIDFRHGDINIGIAIEHPGEDPGQGGTGGGGGADGGVGTAGRRGFDTNAAGGWSYGGAVGN